MQKHFAIILLSIFLQANNMIIFYGIKEELEQKLKQTEERLFF